MKLVRRAALAAGIAAAMTFSLAAHAQQSGETRAGAAAGGRQQGQQTQGEGAAGSQQTQGQGASSQQTQGSGGQRSQGQGAGGQQQSGKMDAMLATCVLLEGQKQISVCQMGLERAQNARVKQFAQAEIQEHQQVKMKLEQKGYRPLVAMQGTGSRQGSQSSSQQSGVQQTSGQQQGGSPQGGVQQAGGRQSQEASGHGQAGMGHGQHPMLQIKQELTEQCVATQRKELGQKQGAEFDKAFVGMQLAAHLQLHDEVTVFRRHATGELRAVLDEAQPVIEQHISQLKEIMQQLKSERQEGGSSSR